MNYYLGIDIGTSSVKSMIMDARGGLRIAEEYDMDNRRYVFEW